MIGRYIHIINIPPLQNMEMYYEHEGDKGGEVNKQSNYWRFAIIRPSTVYLYKINIARKSTKKVLTKYTKTCKIQHKDL